MASNVAPKRVHEAAASSSASASSSSVQQPELKRTRYSLPGVTPSRGMERPSEAVPKKVTEYTSSSCEDSETDSSDSLQMDTAAALGVISAVIKEKPSSADESSVYVLECEDSDELFRTRGSGSYRQCQACYKMNSNSKFRFCTECYQVRKLLLPPRPRRTKSRSTTASSQSTASSSQSSQNSISTDEFGRSGIKGICIICMEKPKTSGFVHHGTIHVCCCYSCAKRVKRCPICQSKAHNIKKVKVC